MTSRRCTLIEQGAKELLQLQGYTVKIIPPGFNKRSPPAHLVASREPGETRWIRIRKISHRSSSIETIQSLFRKDLAQFRKHLSNQNDEAGLHYEIWIYSLCSGPCLLRWPGW